MATTVPRTTDSRRRPVTLVERDTPTPWQDITRIRFLLAHHYHRTDPEQLWSIAARDIPRLREQLGE